LKILQKIGGKSERIFHGAARQIHSVIKLNLVAGSTEDLHFISGFRVEIVGYVADFDAFGRCLSKSGKSASGRF
jgi:hypothetical protein